MSEMSSYEISKITGLPPSTVRDIINRAMLKLAQSPVLREAHAAMEYRDHEKAVRQSGGSTRSRLRDYLRE